MTESNYGMPDIEIRPTYSIQAIDGRLDREQVPIAHENTTGATVEINIVGEVTFVGFGALMPLATALADADRVIVRAHGSGLDYLRTEVTRAIKSEQQFRASVDEMRQVRQASIRRQVDAGLLPADVLDGGAL